MHKQGRGGLPYGLGAILIWSTSSASLVSLPALPAPALLLATHLVAALFLNGWAMVHLGPRAALAELGRLGWRPLAYGFLGTYVYQMGYVLGLKLAPPAEANLLNYLWPLFTALLAVPIRGEKGRPSLWLALACGLAGMTLLVSGPTGGDYPLRLFGYLGALIAALSWGIYSNLLAGLPENPLTLQRAFVLVGAGGFAITAVATGTLGGPPAASSLGTIAYIGIGPLASSSLLWQESMRRGPVQQVAAVSYLTPVLSTLWLSLITGTPMTTNLVAGLVLVLVAAVLPSSGSLWRIGYRLRHLSSRLREGS